MFNDSMCERRQNIFNSPYFVSEFCYFNRLIKQMKEKRKTNKVNVYDEKCQKMV